MVSTNKAITRSIQQVTGGAFNRAGQCLEPTLEITNFVLASSENFLVGGVSKSKLNVNSVRMNRYPATGEAIMLKPRKVGSRYTIRVS